MLKFICYYFFFLEQSQPEDPIELANEKEKGIQKGKKRWKIKHDRRFQGKTIPSVKKL